MADDTKRDIESRRRTRAARFYALMESAVEDFMLDPDGVAPDQSRPFEIVTKNYLVRGSVSSNQREPQDTYAASVPSDFLGDAHVLKHLLAIIQHHSNALVQALDEPNRTRAREIRQVAETAAAFVRRLLGSRGHGSPPMR